MLRPFLLLFTLSWPLAAAAAPVRVILVGDSTMQGRTGYGDVLCQRFVPEVSCINVARGGRSSASFRSEGRWDQVRALLRDPGPFAATYVLIQFGHNDQPGKPGRSTDLVSEFSTNMARYAAEARELGAVPVLVTPLTRRSFRGPWLHDDLAPWSAATRQAASAGKTILLDLNALSMRAVQAMGTRDADTLAQEGAFDYTHLGGKGATLFSAIVAAELTRLFPALAGALRADADLTVPARQTAPLDGWGGGTRGGADASHDNVSVVTSAAELRKAIEPGAAKSRIIRVAGIIDMVDPAVPVNLPSNTTLIGIGAHAGFVNAHIRVANAQQVIIRNLHFQNPCDAAPVWDPKDGAKGNWNSEYDGITVSASTHVWIDHNSFTDAPFTDDKLAVDNGMPKQCHDGALDINKAADFITVSYNHFALHEKNLLVGSGDGATGDAGHLRVSFSNNLFEHIAERAPRVRYGQVHTYNNLHIGERTHPVYPHHYSIGVGKAAQIISQNNAFDIAGARDCEHIVHYFDRAASFDDSGSLLNGQPMARCTLAASAGWRVPYAFTLRPANAVRTHVLANAGAGKELSAFITVDDDGDADFKTIQGAIDHVMARYDKATPVTIKIRNGRYEELLSIRNKDNLTLRGESRDGVLIHATNNESLNPGARRALLLAESSDLLTLDTLTIRNDTLRSTARSAQAETVYFDNDNGRLVVRNASFLSEQDTIRLKGYAWFYRSLVAGNVDFIWGASRVALFEESEIRSVGDSARRTAGGWVVQARTVAPGDKGFVFLNSRLTHGPGPAGNLVVPGATYLARSPGTASTWDNVAFINCAMDDHIAATGWARNGINKQPLPNPADGSGWREYGSRDLRGRPIDLGLRAGGKVLSAQEAASQFADRAMIFSAWDAGRGWSIAP